MYYINDLQKMRGFQALTQGEEETELLLVDNVNDKGKVIGFRATRKEVLNTWFDDEAVRGFYDLAIQSKSKEELNQIDIMTGKYLAEKILRHHIPSDKISLLLKAIIEMDSDIEEIIIKIKKYLSSSPRINNILNEAEKVLEGVK